MRNGLDVGCTRIVGGVPSAWVGDLIHRVTVKVQRFSYYLVTYT